MHLDRRVGRHGLRQRERNGHLDRPLDRSPVRLSGAAEEADAIVRTPSGTEVTAGHRLFGIVEGALLYAHEMAVGDDGPHPHLSARLIRVGG